MDLSEYAVRAGFYLKGIGDVRLKFHLLLKRVVDALTFPKLEIVFELDRAFALRADVRTRGEAEDIFRFELPERLWGWILRISTRRNRK